MQAFVRGLTVPAEDRAALSPATVGVIYTVVASVCRVAVRDRRVASTPCDGIRLPEVEKARVTPLTTAHVEALASAVPAELRTLVILAAGTGLRRGEALGLTRDRLRLLGRDPAVTVDR